MDDLWDFGVRELSSTVSIESDIAAIEADTFILTGIIIQIQRELRSSYAKLVARRARKYDDVPFLSFCIHI